MSLNGVIISLGSVTLQVTRTAQGTRTLGRYVAGPTSTFDITCGVPEPIDGRALVDVPEGRRGDEILTVYTDVDLVAERATPGIDPDVLRYLGSDADMIAMMGPAEPWTVIKVKTWPGFGETHREVQIARAPSPQGVVP